MLDNKTPTAEDFNTAAFQRLYDDIKQNNVKELICLPLGRIREEIKIGLFAKNSVNYQQGTGSSIKILQPIIGKSSVSPQTNPCSVLKALEHIITKEFQKQTEALCISNSELY